jgi:hypothetical protein
LAGPANTGFEQIEGWLFSRLPNPRNEVNMAAEYLRSRRARIAAAAGALALVAVLVSSAAFALSSHRSLGGNALGSPSPQPSEVVFGASDALDSGSVPPAYGSPSDAPSAVPSISAAPATGTRRPPVTTATAAPTQGVAPTQGAQPPVTVTIVAAGDIACDPAQNVGTPADCDQAATANEIGQLHPTAVLALGDTQYENGTLAAYKSVYGPTWGKYKSITYPAIGNHEYLTSGASGYFSYFGVAAYYSFNLGNWHMISLNSECSHVGGCQAGSAQEKWLLANLAAYPSLCTLVYWHEPRWSSGEHSDATQMSAIWADLVAAKVDVVLSGHNHDYERFVPLNASGQPDPAGTTEFVVGTGGKNHYGFTLAPLTGEVVRDDKSFGVIDMSLGPTGYSWKFVPAPGYTFTDSGSAGCH